MTAVKLQSVPIYFSFSNMCFILKNAAWSSFALQGLILLHYGSGFAGSADTLLQMSAE